MTQERIDIEVVDKVDSGAATKLNQIADAADRGHNYLQRLKNALASINTNGVDRLVNAMAKADASQAKLINAQARLKASQDAAALSASKLALQQQRIATESARTEAAQNRAAVATNAAGVAAAKLAVAQTNAVTGATRLATEQQKLATQTARTDNAQKQAALTTARLATEQQRLSTETARTETALQRTASATAQALVSKQRAENAAAAALAKSNAIKEKAVRESKAHTAALEAEAAAASRIKNAVEKGVSNSTITRKNPTQFDTSSGDAALAARQTAIMSQGWDNYTRSVQRAKTETQATSTQTVSAMGRVRSAVLSAYDGTRDAIARWTGVMKTAGNETDIAAAKAKRNQGFVRGAGARNANIMAQIQDIGVSLAGGQNPLLVMVQQGAQLDGIARTMNGGWTQLIGTILRLVAPLAVLGVAITGLYTGFKSFTNDMATRHKPELEAYAKSLGLTEKEMKKLGNTTVGANGKLKEFDVVTITMGDSWNGFLATVKQGWNNFTAPFDGVTTFFREAWDKTMNFLYMAFLGFYGLVVGGMRGLVKTIMNLPSVAINTAKSIANGAIVVIEWMLNKVIDGVNWLSTQANKITSIFGLEFAQLEKTSLGMFERSGKNLSDVFAEEVGNGVREAHKTIQDFAREWDKNTLEAAKTRLTGLAEGIVNNRTTPKNTRDPKTQADYIKETTAQLDKELKSMKLLRDEREVQQRMDQIDQEFLRRRMPLDAQQLAIFGAKIQAIKDYSYIQQQSDRIMEEALGPERDMNAAIEAATKLYDDKLISAERLNQEIQKASQTYREATDPLNSYAQELDDATKLTNLYGDALEDAVYLQRIQQDMKSKGLSIYDAETGKIRDEVAALRDRNAELRRDTYVKEQVDNITNPMLQQNKELENKDFIYAELQRRREMDLLNEEQYQIAKNELDRKYRDIQLQSVNGFFSTLSSLQSSGFKELAAIGKAAAITQATINGAVAMSEALKLPFPANLPAMAQVVASMATVMSTIRSTNAGSYATGGQFVVNGKSGVDANNINMNVTNGERVTIETVKQQREADAAASATTVVAPPVNVKSVNILDPRFMLDALDTTAGDQVFVNRIEANASRIKAILGG